MLYIGVLVNNFGLEPCLWLAILRAGRFTWWSALAFFLCLVAHAETTTLLPVADTFLNGAGPQNNAGSMTWFDAGTDGIGGVRRGLLRFDLSAIPPGSTVTSATLRLTAVRVPSGGVDSQFDLFRLQASWGEGDKFGDGKNGASASDGEATWLSRLQGVQAWTAAGATGDALLTPSASAAVSGAATYSWTAAGLNADVGFWINNPNLNFGWLIRSGSEASFKSVRGFASREDPANVGTLEVGYTLPVVNAPRLSRIKTSPLFYPAANLTVPYGLVSLDVQGDPTGRFDLLYSTNMVDPTGWRIARANIPATNTTTRCPDLPFVASPALAANTDLFYRVRALPPAAGNLGVRLITVASNLASPVWLTGAKDNSGRRFIADQAGQVRILDGSGFLLDQSFLSVSNRMVKVNAGYDERGLLGLAFHPGYSTNGRFFVYYSAPISLAGYDNLGTLSEFKVSASDPNLAEPTSERVVLTIPEPSTSHEGGGITFGPDGYLYIATGDGGGVGDPHGPFGNAQVLTNLLGKILRIDVDSTLPYGIPAENPFVGTPGARPEIYAYGFRNPWRYSFDLGGEKRGFVADVGQAFFEEVDILRKGGNYGWRIMEGAHGYDPPLADTLGVNVFSLEQPIFEYRHEQLGISVIGGFVYRGARYPALTGKYVFADFSTDFSIRDGHLFYLEERSSGIWEQRAFQIWPNGGRLARFVKGFGQDDAGEVYVLTTINLGPSGTSGWVQLLGAP